MKKYDIIFIIFLLILPVLLIAQVEVLIIDNPLFKSRSRSPVKFNHFRHMSIDGAACTDCHHRYEKGRNILDIAELTNENRSVYCSSCHSKASDLEKAYHRLCIKCHESAVKNKKTAGPRLCGECHE